MVLGNRLKNDKERNNQIRGFINFSLASHQDEVFSLDFVQNTKLRLVNAVDLSFDILAWEN